jgi:hypothetical protein
VVQTDKQAKPVRIQHNNIEDQNNAGMVGGVPAVEERKRHRDVTIVCSRAFRADSERFSAVMAHRGRESSVLPGRTGRRSE